MVCPKLMVLHIGRARNFSYSILNQMVNCVFTRGVENSLVAARVSLPIDIIRDLRSSMTLETVPRQCPTLAMTRCYVVSSVTECRKHCAQSGRSEPTSESARDLRLAGFRLLWFSVSNVRPVVHGTLPELEIVREGVGDVDDTLFPRFAIRHVSAPFRRNAFEDILTALVFSKPG